MSSPATELVFTLNNGIKMPTLGLGTYKAGKI